MRGASLTALIVAVLAASPAPQSSADTRCSIGGGARYGDLDGDGRPESVWVTGGRWLGATSACRYVLHAAGARSRWAVTFRADVPPPTVPAVRSVDRRPGAEIAVVVDRGATSAIAEVFTIRGRQLRQMAVPGFGPDRNRLLLFLAAGMSFGGTDCVHGPPGRVIQWTAGRVPGGYHLSEVFFRTDGLTFRPIARRETDTARPPKLGTGFASCPRT